MCRVYGFRAGATPSGRESRPRRTEEVTVRSREMCPVCPHECKPVVKGKLLSCESAPERSDLRGRKAWACFSLCPLLEDLRRLIQLLWASSAHL